MGGGLEVFDPMIVCRDFKAFQPERYLAEATVNQIHRLLLVTEKITFRLFSVQMGLSKN